MLSDLFVEHARSNGNEFDLNNLISFIEFKFFFKLAAIRWLLVNQKLWLHIRKIENQMTTNPLFPSNSYNLAVLLLTYFLPM